MRHLKKGHKLSRTASHRKAMLANMASSLIRYERIQTTHAKARALRPFIEKLLTKARNNDTVQGRRLVHARLRDPAATARLFNTIAPRFKERPGGYTRIVKVGRRPGDNAPLSLIEFVDTTMEDVLALRGLPSDEAPAFETAPVVDEAPVAEETPAEEAVEEAAE